MVSSVESENRDMAAKPIVIKCSGCQREELANEASLKELARGQWLECMDCGGEWRPKR